MFFFGSPVNFVIQGLIAVIAIGVFYNLWASTKVYGGIIGRAVRLLGVGILFIIIAVLERVLINFAIISVSVDLSIAQDVFNLIGLFFLLLGFSKLASVTKT